MLAAVSGWGWVANLANQVAVFPCNADGTMMGDEDDDPFVEDPSELVGGVRVYSHGSPDSYHLRLGRA